MRLYDVKSGTYIELTREQEDQIFFARNMKKEGVSEETGSCSDPDFLYSIVQIYKASYKKLMFHSMAACERIMEKDLGKAATAVIVELLKQEVERGE